MPVLPPYELDSVNEWEDVIIPTDLVTPVNVASLEACASPIVDNLDLLKRQLYTLGVFRPQKVATIAAMKAIAPGVAGDWVYCTATNAVYVWIPGAGFEDTSGDYAPLWYHSTVATGRWQDVATSVTQKANGIAQGVVPTLDADGRLTVTPPNSIVGMPFLGKQADTVTTSPAPAAYLTGTLNLGELNQNDIVEVTGVVHVKSYSSEAIVLNLDWTADGTTTTLINLYPPDHPDYAVAAYEAIPVHYRFQLGADKAANSLRVHMIGSGTSTPRGNIQSLAATVVRP